MKNTDESESSASKYLLQMVDDGEWVWFLVDEVSCVARCSNKSRHALIILENVHISEFLCMCVFVHVFRGRNKAIHKYTLHQCRLAE